MVTMEPFSWLDFAMKIYLFVGKLIRVQILDIVLARKRRNLDVIIEEH